MVGSRVAGHCSELGPERVTDHLAIGRPAVVLTTAERYPEILSETKSQTGRAVHMNGPIRVPTHLTEVYDDMMFNKEPPTPPPGPNKGEREKGLGEEWPSQYDAGSDPPYPPHTHAHTSRAYSDDHTSTKVLIPALTPGPTVSSVGSDPRPSSVATDCTFSWLAARPQLPQMSSTCRESEGGTDGVSDDSAHGWVSDGSAHGWVSVIGRRRKRRRIACQSPLADQVADRVARRVHPRGRQRARRLTARPSRPASRSASRVASSPAKSPCD